MAKKSVRASLESEVSEESPALVAEEPREEKPWQMPRPAMGECVRFWERCQVNEENQDIAFVHSVSEKQIAVAFRSQGFDDVYHRDDPRLVSNPNLRMSIHGVWDFTKDKIELVSRIDDLEERIGKLES
jgi:hypothetical protein